MSDRPALTCDEVRDLAPMFVIGALDPGEMDAVRDHLAGCPDAHAELLELGEAATAMIETATPVEPPAGLKARLMAAAEADLREGRHPSTVGLAAGAAVPAGAAISQAPVVAPDSPLVATPVVPVTPVVSVAPVVPAAPEAVVAAAPEPARPAAPVISLEAERARRRLRLGWLLAAAAAVLVVVLGGVSVSLQRDLSEAQAYRDGVSQALVLAAQPGSTTALLSAKDGSVSGLGVVAADGSVRLVMRGMAPTTGAQVYAAWAIVGSAAPVNIGEFTVGSGGVAATTAHTGAATAPGATLALTLEPGPGATAPTLPIIAAGVTQGPPG